MKCYACKREVPEGARFCPYCGKKLSAGKTEAAASAPGKAARERSTKAAAAKGSTAKILALLLAAVIALGAGGYALRELTRKPQPIPALVETPPQQGSVPAEAMAESPEPAAEAREPLTLDRFETVVKENMSVEYPVFRGSGAEAVNAKLSARAEELCTIQYEEYPQEALSGEYRCAVTLQNERVLSLIFWGWSYIEGGIHPWTDLIPMNLDLQTLESFKLSQLYRMDDPGFAERCYAQGVYPGEPDTCYGPELYDEAFAHERDESRSLPYADNGFLKPEGVVVSAAADHFTGSDHIEILVPWDALADFYIGTYDPTELRAGQAG